VARRGNWVFNPNSGGKPIPELVRRRTDARLRRYAEKHFAGRYSRLEIRFRSQFCYIDAYTEPAEPGPRKAAEIPPMDSDSACRLPRPNVTEVRPPASCAENRLVGRTSSWPPANWPETREEYIERLRKTPIHLCRLRYSGDDEHWGFAFFAYSSEKYELSVFPSGQFFGPPEDAFEVSANVHLQ
jgi:hypothetical protein